MHELLFNLPYVHRTYCLSYPAQQEMFLPLKDIAFEADVATNEVHAAAELSKDFVSAAIMQQLPPSFIPDPSHGAGRIRSANSVMLTSVTSPTAQDVASLRAFHRALRDDLFYINGAQTLWYVKSLVPGPPRVVRQTTSITFAAMHRLSEISRYHPTQLKTLLAGERNWLISEFINMSAVQFIDEIASEITGQQILTPNIRVAT